MNVSIIVPTLNRLDLVQQMFGALQDSGAEYGELLLVDNGTDGTTAWAKAQGITVLKPEEPLTFAQSNNMAAKAATGDYLLLLNNDCLPLPGFLAAMTEGLSKGHIIGAKLLYESDLIQHAGLGFTSDGYPQHLWRYASRYDKEVSCDAFVPAVTFACVLVPKIIWDALDGLDEGYVNGFEDIDFCLRAKEKGAQIMYCAAAELYHLESQTVGVKHGIDENTVLWYNTYIAPAMVYRIIGMYPVDSGVTE